MALARHPDPGPSAAGVLMADSDLGRRRTGGCRPPVDAASMKKRTAAASIVALGLLALAPATHAADETDRPMPSRNMTGPEARNNNPEGEGLSKSAPSRLGKADRAFMTKARGNGLYEIAAAKLAIERASDPRVIAFASTLVRDHAQAQRALGKVASSHNYPLPEQPPDNKRAALAQLAALSGPSFDRAFRNEVGVKAQQAEIKLLERTLRSTRTPDLKDWIETTLPMLEAHLKRALELKER